MGQAAPMHYNSTQKKKEKNANAFQSNNAPYILCAWQILAHSGTV